MEDAPGHAQDLRARTDPARFCDDPGMRITQNPEPDPVDTAPTPWWHKLYWRAVREPNDLVAGVRTAVEYGPHDPVDSVEMISAAGETTRAVGTPLSRPGRSAPRRMPRLP